MSVHSRMLLGALSLMLAGGGVESADAAIQTKVIVYQDGPTECRGFLAWDDAQAGPRPGVLVVHEWWGLNDYARDRARQLAALGYLAFAADMYGEGKTTEHPSEAGEMASHVRANVQQWRARAGAGLDVLRSQPLCDASRVAAIGYCFGGSTALQLAYAGSDLRAVATFHAALPTPTLAEAKRIRAKLLVNHGAADSFVPEASVQAFRRVLDEAQVAYDFEAYPGARHSFTVPTADSRGNEGMKYDAQADQQSWAKLKDLLRVALETK